VIDKKYFVKGVVVAIFAGQVVRGDNFWDRPYLIADILDVVESAGHVLLVAPRRVGKTSLMYRIMDTMGDEYIVVYVNTEAEHNAEAFWKKLFDALMDEEFVATIRARARNFWAKITSIRLDEAGMDGIKFGDSKTIDYAKAFEELLRSYDGDKKLIIMMDEFSQTIYRFNSPILKTWWYRNVAH
jgi:AAA+ ATPase superfamily predicted ATPase